MDVQLKILLLNEISPDPTQPRTFYDEDSLQELAESIKGNGVYEPILVRLKDGRYIIVFGHRRYKASLIAGKTTIPAMIREMTDDEAFDAQVTENLQRADPHPMDEAVAFKRYIDIRQMKVPEIAAKIGKKEYFVKQRLRLNDLLPEWQKVFFKNYISVHDALMIAQLPRQSQIGLYSSQMDEKKFVPGYKKTFTDWTFNQFKGILQNAAFDISDATLVPEMGACTACIYNTSFASLFPGDEKDARCNNVGCFNKKSEVHLQKKLDEAMLDPLIVFVDGGAGLDSEAAKKLKKAAAPILKKNQEYEPVQMPVRPSFDEFKKEFDPKAEESYINEEFAEAIAEFDQENKQFQKKVDTGKYVKAFVIDGNEAGKTVYVELKQKGVEKSAAAAVKEGTAGEEDIREEIKRLREREVRAQELDNIKVHDLVKANLSVYAPFFTNINPLSSNEQVAMIITLKEEYAPVRTILADILQIKIGYGSNEGLYQALLRLPSTRLPEILAKCCRAAIIDKLITGSEQNPAKDESAAAIRRVALEYFPDVVKEYDNEQAQVAIVRIGRVNKRIEELEAQLTKLQPEPVKAAKKKAIKERIQ